MVLHQTVDRTPEQLAAARRDNLPLHYVLTKVVLAILGTNEFALRLLPAVAGILGTALAAMVGWQVGKAPGGILAAWFFAFHPMVVWYSRDARPYALALALSTASLIAFLRTRSHLNATPRLLALASLALGMLSHYYFVLVLGALVLLALGSMRHEPLFFRRWTLASLAASAPLAAWVVWFLAQPNPHLGIGWIQPPALHDILGTLWNFASGYGGESSLPTAAFGLCVTLLVALAVWDNRSQPSERSILLTGLLLPILGIWVVSQRRAVYMDRYFIVLLPFVTILVAGGAQRLWHLIATRLDPRRLWAVAGTSFVLLVLLGCSAGWQVHINRTYAKEDCRGLAEELGLQAGQNPAFWLSDVEALVALRYYYRADFQLLAGPEPGSCREICWWILRQPYTATHAFAQGVSDSSRPWIPDVPTDCRIERQWESPSGLAAWSLRCEPGS